MYGIEADILFLVEILGRYLSRVHQSTDTLKQKRATNESKHQEEKRFI